MPVRRVVAGERTDGTSAVASDGVAPRSHAFRSIPGLVDTLVWAFSQDPAADPFHDATLSVTRQVPAAPEIFVRVVRIPPDAAFEAPGFDAPAAAAEMAEVMPDVDVLSRAGLHRTPTADLGVLVSGALRLVMGNGDTVAMAAGDVFVQVRGEHRWSNPTSEPAVLFIVHVPAVGDDLPAAGPR